MKITTNKIEKLKDEIVALLHRKEIWIDTAVFCNGKCWSTSDAAVKHFRYNEEPFVFEADPHDYVDGAGDILTMIFEGDVCHQLYYEVDSALYRQFKKLFMKYGLSFYFTSHVSLTACEL